MTVLWTAKKKKDQYLFIGASGGYFGRLQMPHPLQTCRWRTLILWITALNTLSLCQCCPFYTLDVSPPRTNYTTLQQGLTAAIALSQPLHVCNAATVAIYETVVPFLINAPVTLVGDVDEDSGERAFLVFEDELVDPVFVISAGGALTLRTVQLIFANTLIRVQLHGAIAFDHATCWFGDICVQLDTAADGATLQHAYFYDNAIAILALSLSTTPVVCTDCRFIDQRTAAILSRTTDMVDAFAGLTVTDPVFVDTPVPFGTQATVAATVIPAELSADFVRNAGVINAQTYSVAAEDEAVFQAAVAGMGAKQSLGASGKILLGVFSALLMALIMALVIACVFNAAKYTQRSSRQTLMTAEFT